MTFGLPGTGGAATDPLILTARFDPASQDTFQNLRDRYFPAERNIVPAHLTLFHKLPQDRLLEIEGRLKALAARTRQEAFTVDGVRNLGRGVALELKSPCLEGVSQQLQDAWYPLLSPQDRQRFRPHITIQNKVDPETARRTLQALSEACLSIEGAVWGLTLWLYRNGPWQHYEDFAFAAA